MLHKPGPPRHSLLHSAPAQCRARLRSPPSPVTVNRRRGSFNHAAEPSFAAAFHHLPAVVAELVFLAGKTIKHAAAAAFRAGAESLGVGAAGAAMMTFLLSERQ